jgi:hypothetical protein
MLDGDPGLGKSQLTLAIAAVVSSGGKWPDGTRSSTAGDVIIISGEDDAASVIAPRLAVAGADLDRVHIYPGPRDEKGNARPPGVPDDVNLIRAAIQTAKNPKLLIIDPIVAHLGDNVKTHNDASVRKALGALRSLAEELDIAILVVRHLNKGGGTNALYRGGGSIGFIGQARSAILVAPESPDNKESLIVMAQSKSNNGRKSRVGRTFHIETAMDGEIETSKLAWDGTSDLTAGQLLGKGKSEKEPTLLEMAKSWLAEKLQGQPRLSSELLDEAEGAGFSKPTIKRARAAYGESINATQKRNADTHTNEWWLSWVNVFD